MKNIMIIGPAFSGKSKLANFLKSINDDAVVLNVKNLCISKALSSGENPDTISRSFTLSEIKDAVDSYLSEHHVDKDKSLILDGLITDVNHESLLFTYDFIDHIVLIKKDSGDEMFEEIKKLLENHNKEFTVMEFKNNNLSFPNVFKL